jgi:5-oxopent-3-ene-1,2,5-tricarboxylate decarboxylase/2-hydroxyhepta-2,4-diene-1,7-dioate isomerase
MKTGRVIAQGQVRQVTLEAGEIRDSQGRPVDPGAVTWLPPVTPRAVVGLALNYADHATELKMERPPEPALFFKPLSSLIGHQAPIVYPSGARHCHYETELAVVIGREAHRIKAAHALDYVGGYTVANDFTCRDFVTNLFRPPVKAKGFDSFGPLGPWLTSADEVADPAGLTLRTTVNGEVRQEGNTRDLLFTIPEIIEYLTQFLTLTPGDVILTGTPSGISPVHPGDLIRCEVEGLGALENPVVAEEVS